MNSWNSGLKPFGVPLYFNPTSLLWLVFFMGYGLSTALGMFVVLMLSLLVHEYGHVLAGRRMGFSVSHVDTHMFGAAAVFASPLEEHPHSELITSLAGPATSALLGAACLPFLFAGGPWFLVWACKLNFFLAIFNILPIFPMDGGRILRSLLSIRKGVRKSTSIAVIVSIVMAGVLAGLGLLMGDFWLLMLMGLVMLMAWQERKRIFAMYPEEKRPEQDIWLN